jgi:hypothetical protein
MSRKTTPPKTGPSRELKKGEVGVATRAAGEPVFFQNLPARDKTLERNK